MWRNVVIAGVVISGVKCMARDRKSEGTRENMSDVAECRYSRSRYGRFFFLTVRFRENRLFQLWRPLA